MIRRTVGQDALPYGVYFSHAEPSHRAEYRRIFGGSERFGHDFTGLEFDRAWLDRAPLHRSAELYEALLPHAERALERVTGGSNLPLRVQHQIASSHTIQKATMHTVAQGLGMSVRSLRRRLLDEGTSFNALAGGALGDVAKRLLESPDGTIQQTTYAMGFANPPAFHRAFKRWT
ncbi:MAG: hypothetical protein RLZZ450_2372, partial [Pseudomonadota bacterium]